LQRQATVGSALVLPWYVLPALAVPLRMRQAPFFADWRVETRVPLCIQSAIFGDGPALTPGP